MINTQPKDFVYSDKFDKLVRSIQDKLSQTSKTQPTLTQEMNITMGLLCEKFKNDTTKFEKQIKQMLMSQLKQQMTSTVTKLDNSILEGCFIGLEKCLISFPFDLIKEKQYLDDLYDYLVKMSELPVATSSVENRGERRQHNRAALNLFARHSILWASKLVEYSECKYWNTALKDWTISTNSQVMQFLTENIKNETCFLIQKKQGNLFKKLCLG